MTPGSPLRTLFIRALVFFAVLAGAGLGQAQDLCSGLVQDKLPRPMTALAKPALYQTVADPQFGTTIRRITAVPASGSNPVIKPHYATISAWNSDETYLLLFEVQGGRHRLHNGRTYAFIKYLDLTPPDLEQVFWSTTDPDVIYYVSYKTLIRYHVSTGQKESVRTFSFCTEGASGGGDPMFGLSWDSKRIALGCGNQIFTYDISTDTILGQKTLATYAPQMTPSGSLAYLGGIPYQPGGGKVMDVQLNVLRSLDLKEPWGHSALGRYTNGHDTWNGAVYDPGPAGNDDIGMLVTWDLTNATSKVVIGPKTGWPYPPAGHISTMARQRPGWVFVSTFGNTSGAGLLDMEMLVADTNTGKVCRIGRHRSWGKSNTNLVEPYWAEAHMVPSPSGTRAVFASDWGNGSTVDAYVVELPSNSGANGDLSLTLSGPAGPVGHGVDIAYTLTARNLGSTSVTGVSLTDTLPSGSTFVSASAVCSHASGTVSCALGTLAAAATNSVTITVSADAVGSAVNQASISGGSTDPNTSNNSASVTTIVVPLASIGDVTVTEGNSGTKAAQLTVSLSAGSASTITVPYATANGTATVGSDYLAKAGTLTFTPGSVQQTVSVTVNGDTVAEPNETFAVSLSSPSGATLADAQGQATITNDDAVALPTLSINDVSLAEGNSGTRMATFTVALSSASGSTLTAAYATANGTASAGNDYVAQTGNLTFTAGQTSKAISITVNGDTTTEPNETFVVTLSGPSGATLADAQGQGTISNDDGAAPPVGVQPVVWASAVGVSANANSITKTAAAAWGNAGAISTQQIASGDGYIEFTASETTTYRMIGLSKGNTNNWFEDIDFGLYVKGGGGIEIHEGGISKGSFGAYVAGDKLRIAVVGGVVKYSRNGSVLYSSTKTPTYPLLVDTALYNTGATLNAVVISGAP